MLDLRWLSVLVDDLQHLVLLPGAGFGGAGFCRRHARLSAGRTARQPEAGKLADHGVAADADLDGNLAARKTARERSAGSIPRLQYQTLPTLYAGQRPDPDAPVVSEHRCSLFELSKQRCRWPISTPGAADFCFCGNTPIEGMPYCAGHTRLAYRPGSRQRVARG